VVGGVAQWLGHRSFPDPVAPTPQGTGDVPPLLQMALGTDRKKALTKTTDCDCRAKKVEGHDNIIFFWTYSPSPTFDFVPAPLP